jgi:hypothetical protein
MQNLITLLINKAGYNSGMVRAEFDYKESAKHIVTGCDNIALTRATRDNGNVIAFGIESELGYQILTDAMQCDIEEVYVEGSSLDDRIRIFVSFANGIFWEIDGIRQYAD